MKSMIRFTATAAAIVIALGIAALPHTSLAAGDKASLHIVSWGGAYSESQRKAYHEPYEQMTGTRIVQIPKSSVGLSQLRAQVDSGNVTWDLIDMDQGMALRACQNGIAERIDYDRLLKPAPNGDLPSEDFIPELKGCLIPQILYSTVLAYNTQIFAGENPDSVRDVWNLDAFPGKRSLMKQAWSNLEWALMADGVAPDRIYEVLRTPQGVDQAFAKLSEIKDQVVWWQEGAQPPQLLADREVSIASGYNGRFFNAQVVEDQPIEIIWDGQLFIVDGWVVAKGRLTDEVKRYLRFATDTQRLADQAKYISYGPARRSSAKLVGRHEETGIDMKPHMPTSPDNLKTAIAKDSAFWGDHGDELAERFNAWLAL